MIIRMGFAPRALGLTAEEALGHWRGTHGDLATQLPGLRRYVQNHPVLRDGRPLLPYPGFDIFAETEFDSLDSMDAAFASEHYLQNVTADEHELIRRDRFSLALAERSVLIDGDPGGDCVKLITLLRAHPARPLEVLLSALRGPYADRLAGVGPLRHELLVAVAGRVSAFEVADELWFATPEAALSHVGSEAAQDANLFLAGLMLGREQVIARPVLVAGPRLPQGAVRPSGNP